MSVRFRRGETVAGLPLPAYRDILAHWVDNLSVVGLTRVGRFGLGTAGPFRAACIVDDAEARGLVGAIDLGHVVDYGATPAGRALLAAKALPPIPAAEAEAIIAGLTANAAALNARPDVPFRVGQIWLFGSLAKGAPAVNDVDVTIEVVERTDLSAADSEAQVRALARSLGIAGRDPDRLALAVEDRLVHGRRRHPRLQVMESVDRLIAMGEPCRLVFDGAQGGPVDAPTLPRHPRSPGRDPAIGPPRGLPDLSRQPTDGPLSALVALYLATELSPPALRAHVQACDLVTRTEGVGSVHRWASRQGPLDERVRFCLVGSEPGGFAPVALMVDRTPLEDGGAAIRIEGIYFPSDLRPSGMASDALAHAIATMAACDAEKARFRGGPGARADIAIISEVDDEGFGQAWTEDLCERVALRMEALGVAPALPDEDATSPLGHGR